jgi:DinB family protein
MPHPEVNVLLSLIDQAFDHKSWHGTNLKGSIRGLNSEVASWRPSPGRHNIWELVVHAAYWKYVVRRRLIGEKRGSFPLKGSNWFTRPSNLESDERAWKSEVSLLIETHRGLRDAIADLSGESLRYVPPDSKVSNLELITGIASHDLYHAGQIQLLKRLGSGGSS